MSETKWTDAQLAAIRYRAKCRPRSRQAEERGDGLVVMDADDSLSQQRCHEFILL